MSAFQGQIDLQVFEDDDDESDDEVFTRGGKPIPLEENGVNKPLMAPRQRTKDNFKTKVRKVPPIQVIWAPTLYFLVVLSAIIGIICLVVFLINVFMRTSKTGTPSVTAEKKKLIPCKKVTVEDVWVKTFPKLTTETAIRLNDVNGDGIEDIIIGFGTGADAFYYPPIVCNVYFPNAKDGCGGGVLALDGKTGDEIWRHYSPHEIFALNCNIDLDEDGTKDCVGGGRMAMLRALSGKDGKIIWYFDDPYAKIETSNVYTPQFVSDVDFDGVPDLVVVHGGDPMKEPGSKTRLIGRLMMISGKTGQVLRWVQVPDGKESYYSPQVLMRPDGAQIVLFGTGGETHGGSLWYIKLKDFASKDIKKAKSIYTDKFKGVMTPPVLTDITGDGVLDIVMAMFNSSVVAFNGLNFAHMWEYQQPSSESYSTPGVGFFNNDSVPDFIINYQKGPGFPIYYYTQTTILDGRNGLPLLKKPIKMVVGTQSSPLVISVEGRGNDIFLFWVSDCHGSKNGSKLEFDFIKGTSVHDQSRADFCKLRFKEKLFTRLYALTSQMEPPGIPIYDSDRRKGVEFSNPINYTALGLEFLYRHPEYQEEYNKYMDDPRARTYDYPDAPSPGFDSHYDDMHLQGALNNDESVAEDRNSVGNYQPIPDQNADYWLDDRPDPVAIPYYMHQKYPNLGNQYYNPQDYQHVIHHSNYPYSVPRQMSQSGLWPGNEMNSNPYGNYRRRTADDVSRASANYKIPQHHYANQNAESSSTKPRKGHSGNKKQKRHVGPHDGGGIQRVISTGTLAPPVNSSHKSGIDVVFATFWFYPSSVQGLMPEDKECIATGMKHEEERFQTTSQFYGMDHDAYEEMITEECLRRNGHYKKDSSQGGNEYNPFNRQMGQMTVYRLHVDCACDSFAKNAKCARILPFNLQSWPSYMGRYADSVAIPRR